MASGNYPKIENDSRSFSRTVGDNRRLAVFSEVHCVPNDKRKTKRLRIIEI